MLPFLRKFGKAALAIELSLVGGGYYIFHDINTNKESRKKWDDRPGGRYLIDAFYQVTGDERVIEHRKPPPIIGDGKYSDKEK